MADCNTNLYYLQRQEESESNARSYPRKFPFALASAKGCWITDVEGNRYLDFLCGAGTLALGHNDPEIKAAMLELLESGAPLHTLDLTTPTKDQFVHALLDLLPGKLRNNAKIQFCSPAGTDATDAALKLCKTATGRSTVVAFQGAFHGQGHGALGCTGNVAAKEHVANLMPGVQFFPYPYPYRSAFGLPAEADTDAACAYFENVLKNPECGFPRPAAVLLESFQGEGGVVPAPAKFLRTIRRVTEELDIPMICDEIQCGCGRTGTFFAFEQAGIVPDMILISKAIGGSQPLAVVVYDKKLDKWLPGAHSGTFRGNQLAMKAGLVVMKRVSDPAFLAEVTRKGNRMLQELRKLAERCPVIGDVRGRGLMIGIEFVNPKGERNSIGAYPSDGKLASEVQRLCFANGLVMERGGRDGSVMRCLCALTVTDDDIDFFLKTFSRVVEQLNENYR
jgi:diaminobutyrate-2-oxoglutarate transaminase